MWYLEKSRSLICCYDAYDDMIERSRLMEDDGRQESPAPDGIGWSLARTGLCGQTVFMRPCQLSPHDDTHGSVHPLAPICATEREMVFIVDDDAGFRAELVELVEYFGYPAIGCEKGAELKSQAGSYQGGCILLDVKLPGQDGLAIQQWLHKSGMNLPVIFVSGTQDINTIIHCMKTGIVDFLQKPFTELALRRAIEQALAMSRKRHCFQQSQAMVRGLIASLTPTELLVARKIAKGYVTKQIAAEMERSENTVKIHRQRIFQKLMVNSTASVANLMRHSEEADPGGR